MSVVITDDSSYNNVPTQIVKVLEIFSVILGKDIQVCHRHEKYAQPRNENDKLFVELYSTKGIDGKSIENFEDLDNGVPGLYDRTLYRCQWVKDNGPVIKIGQIVVAQLIDNSLYVLINVCNMGGQIGQTMFEIMTNSIKLLKPELTDEDLEKSLCEYRCYPDLCQKAKLFYAKRIEDLQNKVTEKELKLRTIRRELGELTIEIPLLKKQLAVSREVNGESAKVFEEEIKRCLKIDSITSFYYSAEELFFETSNIVITYKNKEYLLGRYKIIIPLDLEEEIEIKSLDDFWAEDHPHISDGSICYGRWEVSIDELRAKQEYSAVISLMIQFLSSYNEDNPYFKIDGWPIYKPEGRR